MAYLNPNDKLSESLFKLTSPPILGRQLLKSYLNFSSKSHLPLQILPLLPIPHAPPPPHDQKALPLPNPINIPLRHILLICQLAQILHLLLRMRHPIRIFVQDLKTLEFQLWRSEARSTFPDLVGEAKGLRHGQEREDGVEGGSFFEGFGEDAAAAAVEDVVDAAEYFGYWMSG